MHVDIDFEQNIILSCLKIIWQKKFIIFAVPLIVSLFVGLWTHRQPKYYFAMVTAIMPISSSGSSSTGFMGLGGVSGLSSLLSGANGNSKLIQTLLKSKRMKRDVINAFNLKKRYNCKNEQLLFKKMNREINIIYKKFEEIFVVKVKSIDSVLSADIANYYIENLEKLNTELEIGVEKKLLKILDKAEPPSWSSGPYTKKNMMTSFIFSLIVMLLFVFIYELIPQSLSRN